MKKLIIALGLSVVLMTGCGSSADTATPDSAQADEAVTEEAAEISEEPEAVEEAAEPVEETAEPEASVEEAASEITNQSVRTYSDDIGTTWLQTIVEISNTGSAPLYLSSGAYDIEDSSGSLVGSQTYVSIYPDVIDPGEKAYLYEETTLDNPIEGVQIVPRYQADKAKVDTIRFPVTDDSLKDNGWGEPIVVGRVENTSDEEQSMVYVVAKYFDASDTVIGLSFTIMTETMAPGAVIGFETSSLKLPDDVKTDTIARYEVIAYPLQMQF